MPSRNELIQAYRNLFGRPPPAHASVEFMQGNLEFQRQGGLPPEIHQFLMDYPVGRGGQDKRSHNLALGVKLVREWQGDVHEVQVVGVQQFRYRQQTYKSLSAIARQITGTPWNGHAFFGLRKGNKP